jgi:oligoribonuclease NrnB/cAMP/cGMP phosphodiesterase (DHH superfamily)
MFKKIIQFSHNDLDGYGCNVVTRVVSKLLEDKGLNISVENHNCDYDSIDEIIKNSFRMVFDHEFDETLFIVSDISWKSKEVTELLKGVKYFVYADHHRTAEPLAKEIGKYDTKAGRISMCVEGGWCGAARLLDCLDILCYDNGLNIRETEKEVGTIDRLEDFVNIVNNWDLWLWANDPKVNEMRSALNLLNQTPAKLNAFLDFFSQSVTGEDVHLFGDYMVNLITHPIEATFEKDLSRLFSDTSNFSDYISRQAVQIEIACRQYQRVQLPMPSGPDIETVCFQIPTGLRHKSLVSMLAHNKTEGIKDFDCIMIYEKGSNRISLRYPKDDLDLSFVAKCNELASDNTGGGHPNAAGFPVNPNDFDKILMNKKIRYV